MTTITADEVKTRLDAGEDLHLVDVRDPHERSAFNIGGIFLPLGRIQNMEIDDLDSLKKNEEVICYCRSGNRSMQACLILEMCGFTNVKNLEGGMLNWWEKYP